MLRALREFHVQKLWTGGMHLLYTLARYRLSLWICMVRSDRCQEDLRQEGSGCNIMISTLLEGP
jgi:hypothetical protein